MDEEELEKPSSKINLGSFFERIDSVEKVADNALTKSNVNFSVINNQKLLINSINVSIEAMETKIRDIANYIIVEKKVEKDAEQDRLLEQEDKEQKKSMLERALAVGERGPKGDPGKPAEQQQGGGGSFLGGLLKGLATLGISAFALKYIGPVLLPKLLLLAKTKLIPIIGTALKGGFVKLAALLGKVITGLVAKIPFIGKALAGSALFTGVGAAIIGIGNFISNALSGKGGGGGAVTDSNVNITDSTVDTGMTDTLEKKDLVPAESFSEYRNRTGNVESEEEEVKSGGYTEEFPNEGGTSEFSFSESADGSESNIKRTYEGTTNRIDLETGKTYILGTEVTTDGYNEFGALPEKAKRDIDVLKGIVEKHAVNKVEPVKDNVNIEVQKKDKDLSLLDDTNSRVDNIIRSTTDEGNKDQNTGTLVQAETPQVAEADIKPTEAPMPFFRVIKNPYIANSPKDNKLPPEILRMIS